MSWILSMIRRLAGVIGCSFLTFAEEGGFSNGTNCSLKPGRQPSIYSYGYIAVLFVGLTALLSSIALLLYQYLAITHGSRRCQRSVMGLWANGTRLRWDWNQLRFQTVFMVPEIVLSNVGVEKSKEEENTTDNEIEWITGSIGSRNRTYSSLARTNSTHNDGERVSWLGLLEALHGHELDLQKLNGNQKLPSGSDQSHPAVKFRKRTWDLISPDTIRPHAICSISDIAILARRLGMTWQDFRKYLYDFTTRVPFIITY